MESLRRLYANRWVRYFLTLLLLTLVVMRVNPARLTHAAAAVRPDLLLAALLLTVPFLGLKAARWYALLDRSGIEVSASEAVTSLIGGMGLALITPARMGELVRAAYLRDPRKWKIGGLVMLDKGFDVLVLCLLAIPGAWSLLGPAAGLALAAAGIAGAAAVYEPRPLHRILMAIVRRLPFGTKLRGAVDSLDCLSPSSASLFILLTALSFAVVLVQFGLILSSWHPVSPAVVGLTFPLVILTNVLPVTVGGLGLREGVAALLLAHFGVAPADAAVAAFLMFAVNTALPGVAGAILLPGGAGTARPSSVRTLDAR